LCVPTPAAKAPAHARSSGGGAPVRAHTGCRPRSHSGRAPKTWEMRGLRQIDSSRLLTQNQLVARMDSSCTSPPIYTTNQARIRQQLSDLAAACATDPPWTLARGRRYEKLAPPCCDDACGLGLARGAGRAKLAAAGEARAWRMRRAREQRTVADEIRRAREAEGGPSGRSRTWPWGNGGGRDASPVEKTGKRNEPLRV
jgi:hypothetical protein